MIMVYEAGCGFLDISVSPNTSVYFGSFKPYNYQRFYLPVYRKLLIALYNIIIIINVVH